jgi:hypothetical protein
MVRPVGPTMLVDAPWIEAVLQPVDAGALNKTKERRVRCASSSFGVMSEVYRFSYTDCSVERMQVLRK